MLNPAASRYRLLGAQEIREIRLLPHFRDSHYAKNDPNDILNFYRFHFAETLQSFCSSRPVTTIADVGCGYGWLAIACAHHTSARIVAVDGNPERLQAARRIAEISGVGERIEWCAGALPHLPFPSGAFDAVYCIEVLEHAGDAPAIARELARLSACLLTVTTPNKAFPIIHHDTALPFCHWLPPRRRNTYAAACGRAERQHNNLFWSPWKLRAALEDFRQVSEFLTFPTFEQYREVRERLRPRQQRSPLSMVELCYYRAVARLGKLSWPLLPSLAATFERQAELP
jgi:2-polyprenyl-3-methyl-5-hydroxy-6-metoxy-1,4-benzoquinol methylase